MSLRLTEMHEEQFGWRELQLRSDGFSRRPLSLDSLCSSGERSNSIAAKR